MPQEPPKQQPGKDVERELTQERNPGAGESRPQEKDVVRREGGREHPAK